MVGGVRGRRYPYHDALSHSASIAFPRKLRVGQNLINGHFRRCPLTL